ncbi:MAG TPA: Zn-ribbon domain-containing OB-fold protein [Anaerolineales bacterium]|nr:Zn-ribbon domain-containing OB-fold protein [Anaerolineales bacterium]
MEQHVFPTRGLSEKDFSERKVLVEHWALKADYAWDTGVAIGGFLQGLKQGKLLARHCNRCRRTLIPPRMFCEECFRPTDDWVELQDTGWVKTFSLSNVRWDMVRLEHPEMPAVVVIDGASPGMGILHMLGEVEPKAVAIGMGVQAVWKPAAEREGSITDIRYFKPIG